MVDILTLLHLSFSFCCAHNNVIAVALTRSSLMVIEKKINFSRTQTDGDCKFASQRTKNFQRPWSKLTPSLITLTDRSTVERMTVYPPTFSILENNAQREPRSRRERVRVNGKKFHRPFIIVYILLGSKQKIHYFYVIRSPLYAMIRIHIAHTYTYIHSLERNFKVNKLRNPLHVPLLFFFGVRDDLEKKQVNTINLSDTSHYRMVSKSVELTIFNKN